MTERGPNPVRGMWTLRGLKIGATRDELAQELAWQEWMRDKAEDRYKHQHDERITKLTIAIAVIDERKRKAAEEQIMDALKEGEAANERIAELEGACATVLHGIENSVAYCRDKMNRAAGYDEDLKKETEAWETLELAGRASLKGGG